MNEPNPRPTNVRTALVTLALAALVGESLAQAPGSWKSTRSAGVSVSTSEAVPARDAARYRHGADRDESRIWSRAGFMRVNMITGEEQPEIGLGNIASPDDAELRADVLAITQSLKRRQFDKALAAVDVLEGKQPGKPLPHYFRGITLLGKHDVPGARKSFERALVIDASYVPAITVLAKLDIANNHPDAAKKRFDALLARNPKNVPALLALAEVLEQNKTASAEVTAVIGRAILAQPNEIGPRLALVRYHLRAKDPQRAVTAAEEGLAAIPDSPELLDALGAAQQVAMQTREAIATYERLAKLQPQSPHPYVRMAQVQMAAKDYDAALKSMQRALALDPGSMDVQRGVIALGAATDRDQEAIAMAREMQKQRPKEAVGYIMEGNVHATNKSWSQAAAAYRSGLKQVDNPELAIRLHGVFLAGGQASEADKFAATWVKAHAKDDPFRLYLAQIALRKKDYSGAVRQYQTILEVKPDSALVLNNLAWAASRINDPKALEYAERANQLAPGQPAIMDTLGTLLVEKGETARGLELLQQASRLSPNAAMIRLNLAKALLKAGRKDDAKRELDQLAKLGDRFPAHAEVAQMLKTL